MTMASIAAFVADAVTAVIFLMVLVMGMCAIKIALGISTDTRRTFNKYVVPGFPCDGTLFVLARDDVMYAVPAGKSVVSTDMVREVHGGRVARSCDQHGRFTYDDDETENRDQGQNAMDHINSNWSGSVRSQAMTLSASDDDSHRASSPPDSPLAGEMTMHETLMM